MTEIRIVSKYERLTPSERGEWSIWSGTQKSPFFLQKCHKSLIFCSQPREDIHIQHVTMNRVSTVCISLENVTYGYNLDTQHLLELQRDARSYQKMVQIDYHHISEFGDIENISDFIGRYRMKKMNDGWCDPKNSMICIHKKQGVTLFGRRGERKRERKLPDCCDFGVYRSSRDIERILRFEILIEMKANRPSAWIIDSKKTYFVLFSVPQARKFSNVASFWTVSPLGIAF